MLRDYSLVHESERRFGCVSLCLSVILSAQTTPNSDGYYQQLRNITLQSSGIENVRLKRDAATFLLNLGTLCFVTPVNNMAN